MPWRRTPPPPPIPREAPQYMTLKLSFCFSPAFSSGNLVSRLSRTNSEDRPPLFPVSLKGSLITPHFVFFFARWPPSPFKACLFLLFSKFPFSEGLSLPLSLDTPLVPSFFCISFFLRSGRWLCMDLSAPFHSRPQEDPLVTPVLVLFLILQHVSPFASGDPLVQPSAITLPQVGSSTRFRIALFFLADSVGFNYLSPRFQSI